MILRTIILLLGAIFIGLFLFYSIRALRETRAGRQRKPFERQDKDRIEDADFTEEK